MKRHLWMILALCTLTTPALGAPTVYLKDGGIIRARSVWRSEGRVYVLVNRDTLTDFSPAEIDLKRTFARKQRIVKKRARPASAPVTATATNTTTPDGVEAEPQKAGNKLKSLLHDLPKMPERKPENLVPSSGAGGTIKQHKKEMMERANE